MFTARECGGAIDDVFCNQCRRYALERSALKKHKNIRLLIESLHLLNIRKLHFTARLLESGCTRNDDLLNECKYE